MDLVTEAEFARMLRVSRETVQGFRRKGLIPYIPGVPALFDKKDVDAFIAQRREAKATKRAERVRKPTSEERLEAWELRTRFKLMRQAETAQKVRVGKAE